jgi:hypothetical protein
MHLKGTGVKLLNLLRMVINRVVHADVDVYIICKCNSYYINDEIGEVEETAKDYSSARL